MDRRTTLVALGGALPLLMTRAALALPALNPLPPDEATQKTLEVGTLAKLTSLVALKRSGNTFVQGFAHSEIVEQDAVAMALTSQVKPLPPTLPPGLLKTLHTVKNAPDATFDSVYLHAQIVGHQDLLHFQNSILNDDLPFTSDAVHIALVSRSYIEFHLYVLNQLYAANQ